MYIITTQPVIFSAKIITSCILIFVFLNSELKGGKYILDQTVEGYGVIDWGKERKQTKNC
jgi:hypothetical protein